MADNKNDDEDLMSDFRDLFPEEGGSDAEELSPPQEPVEGEQDVVLAAEPDTGDFDELDSFLDDFSQGLDRMNGIDEPGGEPETETETETETVSDVDDAAAEAIVPAVAEHEAALSEPEESGFEQEETETEQDLAETADSPLDTPDEGFDDPAMVDESEESEAEVLNTRQSELDEADLDLAVGHLPDTDMDADSSQQQEIELEVAPAIAAAAATAGMAQAATSSKSSPLRDSSDSARYAAPARAVASGRSSMFALIFSLLAVVGAAVAIMLVLMQPVTQPVVEMAPRQDTLAIDRLRADVSSLTARINELAVIIEGPMSHLRESNEGQLEALQQRVEKLEGAAASMVAASPPDTAARSAPARPQARAAKPEPAPLVSPAARSGGWSINLVSLSNEKDAETELARLRQQGIRVEMQKAVRDGRTWYRLQVPGFDSYEGARAYIETIQKQTGVSNAWVSRD